MRLLVLGGTAFLGRAVARHAISAGHDVTCAARGRSGEPPDGAEFVPVDRDTDDGLAGLAGRHYDAAVDLSRRPSQVRSALAALADRVGHWVYVSTCSVYADHSIPGQRADQTALLPPAPPGEDLDEATGGAQAYGSNKLRCEHTVLAAVGAERAFVCRSGLIVGPEDPSGRFEYWVRRVARGGEVLAPGGPDDAVQFIDVRDLARWLVQAAAGRLTGVYDGAAAALPRAAFLVKVAEATGSRPGFTWVDQDFLAGAEVQPWMGERSLPLWLPLPEYAGLMDRDTSPALANGLRPRTLSHTVRDTLAWLADQPDAVDRCGLPAADEAALLARWHERPL